jgi:hypothetical protein
MYCVCSDASICGGFGPNNIFLIRGCIQDLAPSRNGRYHVRPSGAEDDEFGNIKALRGWGTFCSPTNLSYDSFLQSTSRKEAIIIWGEKVRVHNYSIFKPDHRSITF